MPTNRAEINQLERQHIDVQPATITQLNALINDPTASALVRGPIRPHSPLALAPDAPLRVGYGREVLVLVGGKLREILPADDYISTSWSNRAEAELHVVDLRQRKLLMQMRHELSLRYPLDEQSDILQPVDIDIALTYQVNDPQQVALTSATPLLDLYDAMMDVARRLLDGQPSERILDRVRALPTVLQDSPRFQLLGFKVLNAHLVRMPMPSPIPRLVARQDVTDSVLDRIQYEIDMLIDHNIYAKLRSTDTNYLIHIPLFTDEATEQLSIHVRCSPDYPKQPPHVLVVLNKVEQNHYTPAILTHWDETYTLKTIIERIMDDFSGPVDMKEQNQ